MDPGFMPPGSLIIRLLLCPSRALAARPPPERNRAERRDDERLAVLRDSEGFNLF
jgi:hypothetical protein